MYIILRDISKEKTMTEYQRKLYQEEIEKKRAELELKFLTITMKLDRAIHQQPFLETIFINMNKEREEIILKLADNIKNARHIDKTQTTP
jgi:hypothetical protein